MRIGLYISKRVAKKGYATTVQDQTKVVQEHEILEGRCGVRVK